MFLTTPLYVNPGPTEIAVPLKAKSERVCAFGPAPPNAGTGPFAKKFSASAFGYRAERCVPVGTGCQDAQVQFRFGEGSVILVVLELIAVEGRRKQYHSQLD